MRKLNQIEINHIISLNTVNEKKTFIQNLIIEEFRKHRKGIVTLYTGFGKNYMISEIIKRVNAKTPTSEIDFVTNSQAIIDDFTENYIEKNGLINVKPSIINSYCKQTRTRSSVVFFDEVDTMIEGRKFSKAFEVSKYATMHLCLTATLERSQLSNLLSKGFDHIFDLDIDQAYMLGLIPEYEKINIPIKLTPSEREAYANAQEIYDEVITYFSGLEPIGTAAFIFSLVKAYGEGNTSLIASTATELNTQYNVVLGKVMKWQRAMVERARILNNSENSIKGAIEIAKKLDDKTIIFCANIEVAEKIGELLDNCLVYHSNIKPKEKKEILKKFKNDPSYKYITTVKALNRGKDMPAVMYGIQQGFDSTRSSNAQRFGRTARWDQNNPNKVAKFISLYAEDFTYNDIQWKSQQLVWLKSSQKDQLKITWLNDINELFK